MRVIIRETAYADLEHIYRWIAKDSPRNAQSVIDRILGAIENRLSLLRQKHRKASS
jgi:plasmid stabilization system protein ParE